MKAVGIEEVNVGDRIISQTGQNSIIVSVCTEVCIEDNCIIVEGGMDMTPNGREQYIVLDED